MSWNHFYLDHVQADRYRRTNALREYIAIVQPQEKCTKRPTFVNYVLRYKIQPRKDAEHALTQSDFDPFLARQNEHPTTDNETLTHLLKASLELVFFPCPYAFMYSGIIMGIFATIATAIGLYTLAVMYCEHQADLRQRVKCGHKLYYKTRRTKMSFAEIAEVAFENGPKWCRGFAPIAKFSILFGLFPHISVLVPYTLLLLAKNFEQVMEHWLGYVSLVALLISCLLIPLILLSWIPNLKYLAPVSMIANVFMGLEIIYMFQHCQPSSPLPFSAMEAIGVVMPLENNMENPRHFLGICGVLSQGMSGVTLIYMFLGFLGYLRYGNSTEESITLNLPVDEWPAQAVKVLIALAVFCTFGLQFYVCLEIVWDSIKEKCTKRPTFVNYV
ncbi:Proton-coupled amino acid transporter-like protein pathetic [Lucilia cuprina]|nr:Proton-coupled amino acid transporter-like protein pathetic [Lucilia cuprina]